MLMSVDGKISTGDSDEWDFDKDLPKIPGVAEGLHQYYELEQQTDTVSFNTGKVMAKIGVNERLEDPKKVAVSFVIVDNKPHLTESGIKYLSKWVDQLYLVTTNPKHPASEVSLPNIHVILCDDPINFVQLFERLQTEYGMKRVTIQSGGSMNARLMRDGLIDRLDLVVAPIMVGGMSTPSLMDAESNHLLKDLSTLKLVACDVLKDSYLRLRYDVV